LGMGEKREATCNTRWLKENFEAGFDEKFG
jgi:hypothetical protein